MTKDKFPDKLRITLKRPREYIRDFNGEYILDINGRVIIDENVTPLGFANVYEPNTKAYYKRVETQNSWAYGDFLEKNGELYTRGFEWVSDGMGGHNKINYETLVEAELRPVIIDNDPMEGFKVQKSVSRVSTSNKLWRILDPRGFELEINTDTMEDIIHGGVIDRGLIIGKCVWRTGKILVRV